MQTAVKSAVAALPHSSTLPRHWHALIAVIGGLLLFSVSSASYRTTCVQMVRNSVYNTASPQPAKYRTKCHDIHVSSFGYGTITTSYTCV